MNIIIENCNNFDSAEVTIKEKALNIKYGINGTGKSSIAKAIAYKIDDSMGDLNSLKPFKFYEQGDDVDCSVSDIPDHIKSVSIFNEDYVNNIVLSEDGEVFDGSFEVFIRDEKYDENLRKIESTFSEIKNFFSANENLDGAIEDLSALIAAFGTSNKNVSKNSGIFQGISLADKISNIPQELIGYGTYIKSKQGSKWAAWQTQGETFLDMSEAQCPYCIEPVSKKKVENIKTVSKQYDKKTLEKFNEFVDLVTSLERYFSKDALKKLLEIKEKGFQSKTVEEYFLLEILGQIKVLQQGFLDVKNISLDDLRDHRNLSSLKEKITGYKINIGLLTHLNSEETNAIVQELNTSLDQLHDKASSFIGVVVGHDSLIKENAKKYENQINEFLETAGYKYFVAFEEGDGEENGKMLLKHEDSVNTNVSGKQHLSFGEKNAFALVLFMYQAIAKESDIIILDDPISSFDKNKKYAVLSRVFQVGDSLRGKTVLFLTHDVEPIIDIRKVKRADFSEIYATVLTNRNGIVSEMEIQGNDLRTFREICKSYCQRVDTPDLLKLVYLRRLYEVEGRYELGYEMLSSLFKGAPYPYIRMESGDVQMTQEQIAQASRDISKELPTFDYSILQKLITDKHQLISYYKRAASGHDKVQIFRLLNLGMKTFSKNSKKLIDERYHIENEYILQLDLAKFDPVPEYIVLECDQAIADFEGASP